MSLSKIYNSTCFFLLFIVATTTFKITYVGLAVCWLDSTTLEAYPKEINDYSPEVA